MRVVGRAARFAATVGTLFLLLATGCKTGSDRDFTISRGRDAPIRVQVTNDNFLDANVHVMVGGTSHRLGAVVGKTQGSFEIDPVRIGVHSGVQLLVDLVGSQAAFLSDAVYVNPGGTVVLQIAPALSQSYVILR